MNEADTALPAPPHKWLVALAVGFGSLMAAIDSSIVNVALPHIRGALGASTTELSTVSTSYIIAMVLVMPLTGLLSSLWGQKRVYLASLVIFVVGSVLCGMSHTLTALVAARIIQGLGAGSLQPTQQAILRQTFPPEEQGMAMALFAMAIMVGPAIGPSLGGWLTDNYAWPWIFYVNLPVGIASIILSSRYVVEPEDVREANRKRAEGLRKNLDILGLALLAVSVSSLQYVLEEGPTHDWFDSRLILTLSVVSALSFILLVVHEISIPHPFMNLRLLADRTFLASTAVGGVMMAMLMGSMFLLPLFMQELLHFNATLSGNSLLPRTLAMMVAMPLVGKFYTKISPRVAIGIGVLLFVAGSLALSHISLRFSAHDFFWPLVVTGVGFAFLFVPLTTVALSNIPRHHLSDAAGLNSFVRQIAGSLGLALFATLLTNYTIADRNEIAEHLSLLRPEVPGLLSEMGGRIPNGSRLTTLLVAQHAALEGAASAFGRLFFIQGAAFLLIIPLLFFLNTKKESETTAKPDLTLE